MGSSTNNMARQPASRRHIFLLLPLLMLLGQYSTLVAAVPTPAEPTADSAKFLAANAVVPEAAPEMVQSAVDLAVRAPVPETEMYTKTESSYNFEDWEHRSPWDLGPAPVRSAERQHAEALAKQQHKSVDSVSCACCGGSWCLTMHSCDDSRCGGCDGCWSTLAHSRTHAPTKPPTEAPTEPPTRPPPVCYILMGGLQKTCTTGSSACDSGFQSSLYDACGSTVYVSGDCASVTIYDNDNESWGYRQDYKYRDAVHSPTWKSISLPYDLQNDCAGYKIEPGY